MFADMDIPGCARRRGGGESEKGLRGMAFTRLCISVECACGNVNLQRRDLVGLAWKGSGRWSEARRYNRSHAHLLTVAGGAGNSARLLPQVS